MSALRKLQQDFAQYLTADNGDIIEQVAEQGRIDRAARLSIYQNAYYIRLKDCVETDHPILGLYLGDDLFEQMVTGYIRRHPSRYPSLRQFGEHLPGYLTENEPFRSHPIIAEIAAFERRLMDAFDAADCPAAGLTDLQALSAEQWPAMKLAFHPGLQLFEARWNSVECWKALKNNQTPPGAREQQAWWIIWRDRDRLTQYRHLSVDGLVLYRCFHDGYTLADACELLKEHLPDEQIGPAVLDHLQSWCNLGLVRSLTTRPLQGR